MPSTLMSKNHILPDFFTLELKEEKSLYPKIFRLNVRSYWVRNKLKKKKVIILIYIPLVFINMDSIHCPI